MVKNFFIKLTYVLKYLFSFIALYAIYLLMGILACIISIIFNINFEACESLIFGIAFIIIALFTMYATKIIIKDLIENRLSTKIFKIFIIFGTLCEISIGISLVLEFVKQIF